MIKRTKKIEVLNKTNCKNLTSFKNKYVNRFTRYVVSHASFELEKRRQISIHFEKS